MVLKKLREKGLWVCIYKVCYINLFIYHSACYINIYLSFCIFCVQFSRSVVSDSVTPWPAGCQASLSITNYWSVLKLMFI